MAERAAEYMQLAGYKVTTNKQRKLTRQATLRGIAIC